MKTTVNYQGLVNAKLPPKHLILSNRNIFDQKNIVNSFNEYFANVVPKLTSEISESQRLYEMCLKGFDSSNEDVILSDEKINTAVCSLKIGKSPGFDEVNYDIVKQNSKSLLVPLKCIFDFSLKSGIFPEKMEIVRATPFFKSGDTSLKTGFQHADFSSSGNFFSCADFSADPRRKFASQCRLLVKKDFVLQAYRSNQNCKYIKLLLMACKTGLFVLYKINYFY